MILYIICNSNSLTATAISENWQIKCFTLAISPFSGVHSGERIADKLKQILGNWKIPNERCHAFVTDKGSNMIKIRIWLN